MSSVEENLQALGPAQEATEALGQAIGETKSKLETALAAVNATITEASEAVAEAANRAEMAGEQARTALGSVEDHLSESMRLNHADAVNHLTQAQGALEGTRAAHGANHEALLGVVAVIAEAVKTATEGLAAIGSGMEERAAGAAQAREGIETARTHITAIGNALDTGPSSGPGQVGSTSAELEPRASFEPAALDQTIVERIRQIGWPLNRNGRVAARGLFFDHRGKEVLGRVLSALRPGQVFQAPDLKEPWRSNRKVTSSWHIEGGVAAYLREHVESKRAVLYLNVPPCGKTPFDPARCHANLEKILPEGTTLTVFVVRKRGLPERITFEGTGEAVAR